MYQEVCTNNNSNNNKGKVKGNFIIEPATKAQTGSRGIARLYL